MKRVILLMLLAVCAWGQGKKPASQARRDFRISGTVIDDVSGDPLPDAEIGIGPAEGKGEARAVLSGEGGRFEFSGLAPGKYWLAGSRHGFSGQNFNQHESYSSAIAVGPGLQSEGLVFRLHPDAALSGAITDESGEGVAQAQVMLFRSSLEAGERSIRQQRQEAADDQGHYRFSHLSAGTYFLAVVAHPWYAEPFQSALRFGVGDGGNPTLTPQGEEPRSELDVAYPITFYSGALSADAATPITLQPGEGGIADVGVAAVPALHLRITALSADPIRGVFGLVQARIFDQTIAVSGQSRLVGSELEIAGIAPGQVDVTIREGGGPRAGASHTWEQNLNLARDAEVQATEGSDTATVNGVAQLDGAPARPPTVIQLRNRATGERLGVRVGDKGEFTMPEPVPKGSYEVVAGAPDAVVVRVSAVGAKAARQDVEIAGGTVQLAVTLSRSLGRVDGVALRNDKPLAGAMIVLVPHNLAANHALVRRDQSDSDGSFTLREVVPGRYTLIALEKGWEMEWMNPAVLAPYLKTGEAVEVAANGKYRVRVKAQ